MRNLLPRPAIQLTLLTLLLAALSAVLAGPAVAQVATDRFVVTPAGERVPLRMYWFVLPYWGMGTFRFPTLQYTYYLDRQGQEVLHGVVKRRFTGAKTEEFTTYLHGVREGPFASVGLDFHLRARGQYRDGELDGDVTVFYPSGRVKSTERYRAGVLDGPHRTFHENGTVREASTFVNGRKEGPVTWYHPNGRVAYRGTFREGYLSGPIQVFDPEGHMRAEGTLEREWIVGAWRCYAPDGAELAVRTDCEREFYTRCECP